MTGSVEQRALEAFGGLPLRERLFVRTRLRTAPLEALVRRAPPDAVIADVGCGHGLLSAMLAIGSRRRTVVGIDPDERKIAWARRGLATLPNASFRTATVEQLADEHPAEFDMVVVADVLYLLPGERWGAFLDDCHRLLRPRGLLLLKEAEANGSWKYYKCLLQEAIMVKVARKTRSSGGLSFRPRGELDSLLRSRGFQVLEIADLSRRYSTPHVLFTAERS